MSIFHTIWDVGYAADTSTVVFPLTITSTMTVDWGDGSNNEGYIDTTDVSHFYQSSGQYHVVVVDGCINGWNFSTVDSCAHMLFDVSSTGNLRLADASGAFKDARRMIWTATDSIDLNTADPLEGGSPVTTLESTFENCVSFNGAVQNWDLTSVTSLKNMFKNCTSFNRDLNSWTPTILGIRDMEGLFNGATSFQGDVTDWFTVNVTSFNNIFNGTSYISNVNPLFNWTISGDVSQSAFNAITTDQSINYNLAESYNNFFLLCPSVCFASHWEQGGTAVQLPFLNNCTVSVAWGDGGGLQSFVNTNDISHTYLTGDTQRVIVRGDISGWNAFNHIPAAGTDLHLVSQVNGLWPTGGQAFQNCTSMTWVATDSPILSGVTDMCGWFQGDVCFNGNLSAWNISAVTRLDDTFNGCTDLNNTGLDNWNTSNVVSMLATFQDCTSFNSDLSWNTSQVTNLSAMFSGATSFNGDISGWNTQNNSNLAGMFQNASVFNRDLYRWNTSKVTNVNGMFNGAGAFNGDINSWNLSNAEGFNTLLDVTSTYVADNLPIFNWTVPVDQSGDVVTMLGDNSSDYRFVPDPTSGANLLLEPSFSFITRWDTSNSVVNLPFSPDYASATIVAWGEGAPTQLFISNNISYNYGTDGSFNVVMIGDASGWDANTENKLPEEKLRTVMGVNALGLAIDGFGFYNCSSMTWTATDAPDLTGHTSLQDYFSGCENFDGSLDQWDTSGITNMMGTFVNCKSFNNSSINNWDTSAVGRMDAMFLGASIFNQDLNWSVGAVRRFTSMFKDATEFNGIIDTWNTSSATDMQNMFHNAVGFVQDINSWDVSSVDDFHEMFRGATGFNSELTNWNTRSATDMHAMFQDATLFNSDIGSWNVARVLDMSGMFQDAETFNRDLYRWDMASVTDIGNMFNGATQFAGDINSWNLRQVTNMDGVLTNTDYQDTPILNWDISLSQSANALTTLGSNYVAKTNPTDANYVLIEPSVCFVSRWDTSSQVVNLPFDENYNSTVTVAWGTGHPTQSFTTNDISYNFGEDGSFNIVVKGDTSGWNASAANGKEPNELLRAVVQTNGLRILSGIGYGFANCSSMTWIATDSPILEGVTDMGNWFIGCTLFDGSLDSWDVQNINNMGQMFSACTSFTGTSISGWNVGNVQTGLGMFQDATSFQADLKSWNVGSMVNAQSMFQDATQFNSDISSWNVNSLENAEGMFQRATSFNADLYRWNTGNLTTVNTMFSDADAFRGDINSWNLRKVTDFGSMLGVAYRSTLPILNFSISLDQSTNAMNGITGDQSANYVFIPDSTDTNYVLLEPSVCFVSRWDTSGQSVVLPFSSEVTSDVSVAWGTGHPTQGFQSNDISYNYATDSSFDIVVKGDISGWNVDAAPPGSTLRTVMKVNALKILSGGTGGLGFNNCSSMTWVATDSPDLVGVDNMDSWFSGCKGFDGSLDQWVVSAVTNFDYMFRSCSSFNNNSISNWITTSASTFASTFNDASLFNQDLSWTLTDVTSITGMFEGATAFNGNISNWDTQNVTTMETVFRNAQSFNGDISGWNIGNVQSASNMFDGATSFNQSIATWNTVSMTSVAFMFKDATGFENDLNGWNMRKVTNFQDMFQGTTYVADQSPIFAWSISMDQSTTVLNKVTGDQSVNYLILTDPDAPTEYGLLAPRYSFVSRWNTDSQSIDIPVNNDSSVTVVWGDGGATETFTSTTDISHNYGTDLSYTVFMVGDISGFYAYARSDLLDVMRCGPLWPDNVSSVFHACTSLVWTAVDSPKLDGITTMNNWLQSCTNFDGSLGAWDVSGITSFSQTFRACSSFNGHGLTNWNTVSAETLHSMFDDAITFNQNLYWNTSNVTSMTRTFQNAVAFNGDVSGWDTSEVRTFNLMFNGCQNFTQNLNMWNVTNGTNFADMFTDSNVGDLAGWDFSTSPITVNNMLPADYIENNDFVFNWRISADNSASNLNTIAGDQSVNYIMLPDPHVSNTVRIVPRNSLVTIWNVPVGQSITLPLTGQSDFSVHWDDGAVAGSTPVAQVTGSGTDLSHNFIGSGYHYVVARGADISGWNARSYPPDVSFVGLMQAGNMRLADQSGAFEDCNRMVWYASTQDNSLISTISTLEDCFRLCTSFDANLDGWDVSGITSIRRMFQGCTSFNHDLSWNVGNVTDMSGALQGAILFNYDLQDWSVGNVTTMAGLFHQATAFRGDIASWNTKLVTDFTNVVEPEYIQDLDPMFRWSICGDISTTLFNQIMDEADNSGDYHMIPRKYADGSGFFWIVPEGALLLKWTTTDSSNIIHLPIENGVVDISVGWADKYTTVQHYSGTDIDISHTYPTYGYSKDHYIVVRGQTGEWNIAQSKVTSGGAAATAGPDKLKAVLQCGTTLTMLDASGAFKGCSNMFWGPDDSLNTTDITTMEEWFMGCTSMNMDSFAAADLNLWDTAAVTSLKNMFNGCEEFNGLVYNWNTGNVDDMENTFLNCTTFDGSGDLKNWNTSAVTTMNSTFKGCQAFTSDLSGWQTHNVSNMYEMFRGAESLNSDLSWNTSQVTDIRGMFQNAFTFNGQIGNWDTRKVSNLDNVFNTALAFNRPIQDWSVGNVTSMTSTFQSARAFNQDISGWDISGVTSMSQTFYDAQTYDQSMNTWDTGNVRTMYRTLRDARNFNQTLKDWDTSNVTTMEEMFRGAQSYDQSMDNWNVAKVTSTLGMFNDASVFNHYINSWTTTSLENTGFMFNSALLFDQSLHLWNTSRVTDMQYMFNGAASYTSDISSWDTSAVQNMQYMLAGTPFNHPLDWSMHSVLTTRGMFKDASLFNQEIGDWDTQSVTNMGEMFQNARTFQGDISMWNTADVTFLDSTFEGALVFNHDLSWNVANVTTMHSTFKNAPVFLGYRTEIIPSTRSQTRRLSHIADWNTSNVRTLNSTFDGATVFDANITNWDTALCTTLASTFAHTNKFNQPIGSWNVANVSSMFSTFQDTSLFNQPLIDWNTGNVSTLQSTFQEAVAFNQHLSKWNTSNVSTLQNTFTDASSFYGSIDNWNTDNVTNFTDMGLLPAYIYKVTPEFSSNQRPTSWRLQSGVDQSSNIIVDANQLATFQYVEVQSGAFNRLAPIVRYSKNKYM